MRRPVPRLVFTLGDPAGVGAEVVVRLLRAGRLRGVCEPLLAGEAAHWRRAGWRPGLAPLADTRLGLAPPPFGAPSARTGRCSFEALRLALRLRARRLADGIVTEPISKKAWRAAGVPFVDHTAYLEHVTGRPTRMILASPRHGLWTVIATRHVPLADVARRLSRREVAACIEALASALKSRGLAHPRLGLAALNPHAGEDGLLGREERRILAPAARDARRSVGFIKGPMPCDAAWRLHREGGLDGLVCCYHDQALAPLKALVGLEVVNWTVGIPLVRTSPGHGTGFDIAGRGIADCLPTLEAARLASQLIVRPWLDAAGENATIDA